MRKQKTLQGMSEGYAEVVKFQLGSDKWIRIQRWEKEKRYPKEPDRGDSQYIVKDILKPDKDLSSISGKQRVNNIFFWEENGHSKFYILESGWKGRYRIIWGMRKKESGKGQSRGNFSLIHSM